MTCSWWSHSRRSRKLGNKNSSDYISLTYSIYSFIIRKSSGSVGGNSLLRSQRRKARLVRPKLSGNSGNHSLSPWWTEEQLRMHNLLYFEVHGLQLQKITSGFPPVRQVQASESTLGTGSPKLGKTLPGLSPVSLGWKICWGLAALYTIKRLMRELMFKGAVADSNPIHFSSNPANVSSRSPFCSLCVCDEKKSHAHTQPWLCKRETKESGSILYQLFSNRPASHRTRGRGQGRWGCCC